LKLIETQEGALTLSFFDRVMEGERRSILAELEANSGIPPFAAISEIATAKNVPSQFRSRHPARMEALGEGSFVIATPSIQSKVLWVRTDNDAYRASYATYLERHHNGYPGQLPSNLHVDHLYNRERALAFGLTYIRMGLLPSRPNTSHGAGYEKKRTHGVGAQGRDRKIDTVMMMKAFGYRSPPMGGRKSPDMRAFASRFAPIFRISEDAVMSEIADLVAVAKFRPQA